MDNKTYNAADFSVERESLIVEARQLIDDAGGNALDEQASARFSEIEKRLEDMSNEASQRPEPVRAGVPMPNQSPQYDPYTKFGVHEGAPSLVPSKQDTVSLFEAAKQRQPVAVATPSLNFAAVTTAESGMETSYLADRTNRTIRRLADVTRIGSEEVGIGSAMQFPVFGSGSAEVAAEGTLKAEYANIAPGTARPQVIAAWTDITQQTQGLLAFETSLRGKLSALIARREDQLLVSKVLGTTGIQTLDHSADAVPPSESLLEAAALVLDSDVAAEPDVAVVNPADVRAIFGGSFGTSGESPEEALRLALHGMRLYVTGHVAAGSALVGSWQAASRLVVGSRPLFRTDPYSQLKNNIVTILGEEAVDLAVDEPTGFVDVTFSSPA